ncbi:MAG: hypothetical protein ACRYG8_27525 [Janthinobacterium lividum]
MLLETLGGLGGILMMWWTACAVTEAAVGKVAVTLPNPMIFDGQLAAVEDEMRNMGRPRLRAVRDGSVWRLVEGSHRVRAAIRLGIGIELVEVSTTETISDHDWPSLTQDGIELRGRDATAADLLESSTRWAELEVPARRIRVRRQGWPVATPGWLF